MTRGYIVFRVLLLLSFSHAHSHARGHVHDSPWFPLRDHASGTQTPEFPLWTVCAPRQAWVTFPWCSSSGPTLLLVYTPYIKGEFREYPFAARGGWVEAVWPGTAAGLSLTYLWGSFLCRRMEPGAENVAGKGAAFPKLPRSSMYI